MIMELAPALFWVYVKNDMKIRKRGVKLKLYTTPARMYIHVFSFFGTNLRSKLTLYQFLCNFFWRVINSCNEFSYIIIVSLIMVSLVFLITTESQYFDDELKKTYIHVIWYYTIQYYLSYTYWILLVYLFLKKYYVFLLHVFQHGHIVYNFDSLYTIFCRILNKCHIFYTIF